MITVRGTNFEKAADGGSATVEAAPEAEGDVGLTQFVSEELTASDRCEQSARPRSRPAPPLPARPA